MALTRPGGFIRAAAPVVTFLNANGWWTLNQITRFQATKIWPQEFSIVFAIGQQSSLPLIYAWTGSAISTTLYTASGSNAYSGVAWDRYGRTLFYASSTYLINGYEFTKAGGAVSTYSPGTQTYGPARDTMRASPVSDRLWFWSAALDGRLCSITYDTATKTFGIVTTAVYLNNYPFSGIRRPSISPDGNFYGSGHSASGGLVYLFRINNSDGSSLGSISTPLSISNDSSRRTYSVTWNPTGTVIGVGIDTGTPKFRLFRWDPVNYYGSEYSYANFTGGVTIILKVFWNNAGNVLFCHTSLADAASIQAYQWDDINGIGARFADPPSFTFSQSSLLSDVVLSPDDKLLVFSTSGASGSEIALGWNNTAGFGEVTIMPVGQANPASVAFGTLTN